MRLIPNASLPVSHWANGAGRKADVAAGDGWMIGFAWLDEDAPFSDLQGYDRTITLVQGPGFTLDIAGRPPLIVETPFRPAAFDGGAQTQCRIAGPSRVLNVMTRSGRFTHALDLLKTPCTITPGNAVRQLLVVLEGSVTLSEGTATATAGVLDAVELDGPVRVGGDPAALLGYITIGLALGA